MGRSSCFIGKISTSDSISWSIFPQKGNCQDQKHRERDDFEGNDVIRPGPQMINQAWIRRRVGDVGEVGVQQPVHDAGEEEIDIHPQHGPQRASPKWLQRPPAFADRQIQRRADDGKMLGEKREVGRMGEAVADRGSEEGLRGSREAPVVDEFAGQLFPGEQGESGEKRRDIAKMKRHDVVKIRRMIAAGPRPLGVAVRG